MPCAPPGLESRSKSGSSGGEMLRAERDREHSEAGKSAGAPFGLWSSVSRSAPRHSARTT